MAKRQNHPQGRQGRVPRRIVSDPTTKGMGKLSRLLHRIWSIISLMSVIFSIACGIYAFNPKVIVYPLSSLDNSDPLSTIFVVENAGILPLHNVTCQFDIQKTKGLSSNVTFRGQGVPLELKGFGGSIDRITETLAPNERQTLELPSVSVVGGSTHPHGASTLLTINYRVSIIPISRKVQYFFEVRKDKSGRFVWVQEPISDVNNDTAFNTGKVGTAGRK